MKQNKRTNPYEKKSKRRIHLTRKQWIRILCLGAVLAIIVGLVVITRAGLNELGDEHDSEGNTVVTDEHGHAADVHNTTKPGTTNANDKVKYQTYTNTDGTYRLVLRDSKNAVLFEQDKLERMPSVEKVNEEKGVYALGWALYKDPADNGPNDYASVYYNVKTGEVSQLFLAPRGCDGVRIAYGSEDQTKVIVQDLFDKEEYYKEYTLENAVPNKDGDIIVGGQLKNATVVVSYVADEKGTTLRHPINLYE